MQLSWRASGMGWNASMCMLLSQTQQPFPCTAMPVALRGSRKRVRMRPDCRGGQEGSSSENSSPEGSNKKSCRQRICIKSA